MADISDVENELVALAAQALYPSGTSQPCAAGVPVRVYAGWPNASSLDTDLAAGICHATVFPLPMERNTSRYSKDWIAQSLSPQTLTMTIAGQTVTVGGTVSVPQNVMIAASGADQVYAVQSADTLTSIATALATLIVGATSAGPVITLPSSATITAARVGAGGILARELRRQERVVAIMIWADTPAHRDAVAQIIDSAMADLQFMTLPDGYAARVIYRGSPVWDNQQKAMLYRRDLHYMVEYATTETTGATQITQETLNVINTDSGVTLATITL